MDREEQFLNQFAYHAPSPVQLDRIKLVRDGVCELASLLYRVVPDGPDKSAAVRKLREVMMTANAAIVLAPDHPAEDRPETSRTFPWPGVLTTGRVEKPPPPEQGG